MPEASKPCNRKAVHKSKCDSTSVAPPILTDDYARNDRSHAFVRMDTTDRAGLPMSGMAGYTPRMKIPGARSPADGHIDLLLRRSDYETVEIGCNPAVWTDPLRLGEYLLIRVVERKNRSKRAV